MFRHLYSPATSKRRKILIPLLLSVSLILIGIYFTNSFRKNLNPQYSSEHVQRVVHQKEAALDLILEKINAELKNDTLISLQLFSEYSQPVSKNGFIILLFQDDSLLFWSDNSVQVYDYYHDNNFNQDFGKFSDGWFKIKKLEKEKHKIIGLLKIKNDYAYQNAFLKNDYFKDYHLDNNVIISTEKSTYNIYSLNKTFLFSLHFPEQHEISNNKILFLFVVYLFAFIFIAVFLYHAYNIIGKKISSPILITIGFIVDLLIIRVLIIYFEIPEIIYRSKVFDPELFANSALFPSLGDLIINSIVILGIGFSIHKFISVKYLLSIKKNKQNLIATIVVLYIFTLSIILYNFLYSIITNSSISFNLSQIISINFYSFLGFLSFGLLILSFVFLTFKPASFLSVRFQQTRMFSTLIIAIAVFFILFCQFILKCGWIHVLFPLIYITSFWFISKSESTNLRFSSAVFFIFLFSIYTTYILFQSNSSLEKEKRKIIAQKLAENRDPLAEYYFDFLSKQIRRDSIISSVLKDYPIASDTVYNNILDHISNKYFSKYLDKYDFTYTFCDTTEILEILTEDRMINCSVYFRNLIDERGGGTNYKDLYTIHYPEIASKSYLGIIHFAENHSPINLYVEFFPKFIPKGAGYPELLIDKDIPKSMDLSQYSYARYENNKIVYFFGKYFYSMNLDHYEISDDKKSFFDQNNFNHLYFPVDQNIAYLVSTENPGLIDIIAPFSYVFLFYGILVIISMLIFKSPIEIKLFDTSFKHRLQIYISGLILMSFLFIGAGSLYYIILLDSNKNYDILSEKTHSVLIELEHVIANEKSISSDMEHFLSEKLYKFSMVFFSDINLYDLNGTLLATSRIEIFDKGLLSKKMNPEAFNYLQNFKKSLYIHHESIGSYHYLSAYVPFRNADNELIAYLNLPYFAKQNELTSEISNFLVAFINIYVILIAIAIFVALVMANYITKPVQLIRSKISQLKLGKANEKIEWKKKDEIGGLIAEYNRMVDEIERSAELLAKSERESAWREMAKQIAHEIKNPLTPMKLSVQYLQKSWENKSPDWELQLKKFSQTIIEQIDSLSIIASEFSNFAKMPRSKFEKVEITESIQKSIDLFKNSTSIEIRFRFPGKLFVLADKEQLNRVFNNLIKNSIQAISDPTIGIIEIIVESDGNYHTLKFTDNGKGIPKSQRDKVFYPSFTTKSGGMGLGLAMAKNIIQNANGEITFESEEKSGTTFIILLPAFHE